MPKRRKTKKSQSTLDELIIVAFAEDLDQARDYEALLKSNDIPVLIKQQDNAAGDGRRNIAVMVPEEFIDEAHVVIESQDSFDDIYELPLDEQEDVFGSEPFDDDLNPC
jgi:hypothetical protein